MKKILLAAVVLLSLLFTNSVSAHSTLENSSPADGDTVQEQLSEITMQYNTSIDPMSTFTLTDANGDEVAVKTSVNDDTLIGTIGAPLANGEHTVEWNIIGADGHPITGTYSFTVDIPEAAADDSEETVTDAEEDTTVENAGPVTENAATTDTEGAEEGSSTNFLLIGIIVLAAILILTMITLGRKNKK